MQLPKAYSRLRSIQSKFLVVVIPLLLVALIGITAAFEIHNRSTEIQRLQIKLETLSAAHSTVLASSLWSLDHERVALILDAIVADPEVINATVYDETGSILDSSGDIDFVARPELIRQNNIQYQSGGTGETIGVLKLTLTDALISAAQQQRLTVNTILAIFLIAAVGLSMLIANRWSIGKPLDHLLNSIRHNEDTHDRQLVSWESSDEIGTVIKAFNEMQQRQQRYEGELRSARDNLELRVHERTLALVKARDEAEFAKRSMSHFLANVSHELRTPLNAILGLSETMIAEYMGPIGTPKYKEYLVDVHNSGRYLLELIDDILDLSKIEVGRMELYETHFNLSQLARETIRIADGWLSSDTLKVDLILPASDIFINADERSIKQVMLNLISNSIKFTPDDGSVSLTINTVDQDGCHIVVNDTGKGIPEDELNVVMEPFVQAHDPYVRYHEGTGLGLALVKSMVELHTGTVKIESEIGVGTTVSIKLPFERVVGDSLSA